MKKTGKMWGAKEKKKATGRSRRRGGGFSQRQARARRRRSRARTLERSLNQRAFRATVPFTTFLGAERRSVFRHAKKSCREEDDDDEQENLSARFGS